MALRSGKLEKVRLIAEYLRGLEDADLAAAARFFTGNPFATRDQRTLSLGGRSVAAAAQRVWGFSDAQLSAAYRETGDLGAALGRLVAPPSALALFTDTLTPATLASHFEAMAGVSGKSAGKRREAMLETILRACTHALEATYVVKIITGELRIGLREGLIADAIAKAFEAPPPDVRRAVMASGDMGEVAIAARHDRLHELRINYGSPMGFMLASPITYGGRYVELENAQWIAEDKYDGIRAQVHVDGERVHVFSRTLNDVTHSYPEVARALREQGRRFIADGELVAVRDGRVLPFRALQARLQRKDVDEDMLQGVPLAFVVFDLVAAGDDLLIDEPLLERRARLVETVTESQTIMHAPFTRIESESNVETINELFEAARARGNEGLMLKRTDAPYVTGRRGKWWLKLKRELSTLDVVVVAVEWGHGKRAKVLSDYTFAVRGESGELLTIGKAYSGLTDVEIATMTQWFLAHQTGRRGRAIAVEPSIVIEVAFDILQPSDLHESGFSMRFPRIVRLRDDKPASEIDTMERVREIYAAMVERESGAVSGAASSD